MPLYEYVCERCDARFELLRPIARMDDAAACPEGHRGGKRVPSVFASFTQGEDGDYEPTGGGGGCGGCAGGACACAAGLN